MAYTEAKPLVVSRRLPTRNWFQANIGIDIADSRHREDAADDADGHGRRGQRCRSGRSSQRAKVGHRRINSQQ